MNIIEAIKSGKRFRRRGESLRNSEESAYGCLYSGIGFGGTTSGRGILFSQEDILADDWEIEEKKVEVTYKMIQEAWSRAASGSPSCPGPSQIANELGLE